ncbi:MAG: efflux RND transporter periplasmic adaptor subunit [Alphaproteobacteria bacterium]
MKKIIVPAFVLAALAGAAIMLFPSYLNIGSAPGGETARTGASEGSGSGAGGAGGQAGNRSAARGAIPDLPIKIIARPAQIMNDGRVFEALGTGRALRSVQIFPAASDEVTEIFFRSGQFVERGEQLVQLDDREESLALQLAEVSLKDSQSLLERYENAVQKGAVPQSEVDSARAAFERAEVNLESAKLALERRKIIAPFDGYVGIPQIDVGDRVDTNMLITGLDNREKVLIDFEVPESLAGVLGGFSQNDIRLTATTPAYPNKVFEGGLREIESRIQPERRTINVRAEIDNAEDLLRPGMSFSIRLNIPGRDYPAIPEISLEWDQEGSYFWVVRENFSRRIPATVIARRSGFVIVEAEIEAGEPIVTEGIQRLREGQSVEMTMANGEIQTQAQTSAQSPQEAAP